MKSEVVMRRSLFDREVRQKSKSAFLSATDLVEAANVKRKQLGYGEFNMSTWLSSQSTKDFMQQIEESKGIKPVQITRGRNGGTWMHPILFMDLALTLSPKLKLEVYEWLHDELLKYRNDSGDSYQKMAGAIFSKCSDKSRFAKYITSVSMKIKRACGVDDWESASEDKLRLRDKMHNNIALLCSVTSKPDKAVVVGIGKALSELQENRQ